MRFVIYLHRNRVTGKAYVGQTKQTSEQRWREHVKNAGKEGRGCRAISAAIRKYGADAFNHEVLDVVLTQAGADIAEAAWIKQRRTLTPGGYNLDSGRYHGEGRSFHHSEETKRLMSEKAKAREARMTPEERSSRVCGKYTPEERSEIARKRWESFTPGRRVEIGRKVGASLSASEKHKDASRKRWASMTPDQKLVRMKKIHDAQTPDQRSARQKKAWANISAEKKQQMAEHLRQLNSLGSRHCSKCGTFVESGRCHTCYLNYQRAYHARRKPSR